MQHRRAKSSIKPKYMGAVDSEIYGRFRRVEKKACSTVTLRKHAGVGGGQEDVASRRYVGAIESQIRTAGKGTGAVVLDLGVGTARSSTAASRRRPTPVATPKGCRRSARPAPHLRRGNIPGKLRKRVIIGCRNHRACTPEDRTHRTSRRCRPRPVATP